MAVVKAKRRAFPVIEFKNVCAGYDGEEVLHNINLQIQPGKVTVLVGPNGCGKSTLLKTLVRLNPHTAGEIIVQGKNIKEYDSNALAQQVAYLPQNRNVPDIVALKMVLHGRFPYLKYPRRYRKEDFEKAKAAMRWVGIEHLAEENVNRLSGGNQQKVYIAMALAQDTPVIMMDEPTNHLDISHQIRVLEVAKELAQQGKAVVLVLHDLAMALQIGDSFIVMSQGNLVGSGTSEEIFEGGFLDEVFGVRVCRIQTDSGWKYYYENGNHE